MGAMKDKHKHDKEKKTRGKLPSGGAPEIGVVRVFSNPGPDAEERLRRLLSLMLRYATRDGQAEPEQDTPSDAQPNDDPAEEEG